MSRVRTNCYLVDLPDCCVSNVDIFISTQRQPSLPPQRWRLTNKSGLLFLDDLHWVHGFCCVHTGLQCSFFYLFAKFIYMITRSSLVSSFFNNFQRKCSTYSFYLSTIMENIFFFTCRPSIAWRIVPYIRKRRAFELLCDLDLLPRELVLTAKSFWFFFNV